jgi:LAO/AO transport system kinase
MYQRRQRLSLDDYVSGVRNGDRVILSKAITLVESTLREDNLLAEKMLKELLDYTGKSIRIGITGVPGVGKSTYIEAFGNMITARGKRLAVLAVDPSSQRSKGSILGDKTRMASLASNPLAYIRPSASGTSLGGVSSKTRETMLLCEAAGYEIIFIETVGVGQSETAVKNMVDFFLLLMLAGAGDELQGIKKGIMEMADGIVITKADGDNKTACERARREYQNALHLFPPSAHGWYPPVLTCSAIRNEGLQEIWDMIFEFEEMMKASGNFYEARKQQNVNWMHEIIGFTLKQEFYGNPDIRSKLSEYEQQVRKKALPAITAAGNLLELFSAAKRR